MANAYAQQGNAAIAEAEALLSFLERRALLAADGRRLAGAPPTQPPTPMVFYRIGGFFEKGAREDTEKSLLALGKSVLSAARRSAAKTAFAAARFCGETALFFGMESGKNGCALRQALAGSDLNLSTENRFLDRRTLRTLTAHGALLCGGAPEPLWLDEVFSAMGNEDFLLLAVASPLSGETCLALEETARQESERFRPWRTISRSIGRDTRRTTEVPAPGVDALLRALSRLEKRFAAGGREGLFETALWCCAREAPVLRKLTAVLCGALRGDPEVPGSRPAAVFCTPPSFENGLTLPALSLPGGGAFSATPLAGGLCTLQSESALSALFCLPREQSPGFVPIRQQHGFADRQLFDQTPPPACGRTAQLGRVLPAGLPYRIDLDAFRSHALVAGINGAGKSNTTKQLLWRFYEAGIPFGVIEPAKKEYWALIGRIPLRLYSAGDDGEPLRFNPLCPAAGELIGNHIEGLMLAFEAQSLMESPLPEVLRGLLSSTYREFGLDPSARMPRGVRAPTLSDVAARVEPYIKAHTQYSDRVQKDVLSATKVRVESLLAGAPGRMLSTGEPLDVAALFSENFVIELDDLSGKAENFVTSVLMLLFNEYLRAQKESGKLERVLLLEEAHRYFLKAPQTGGENGTGSFQTAAYFSNLLSEIRAHGTGLVLVDQRPGELNGNAIANTAVKIVHALAAEPDAQAVAFSLGLSDAQLSQLRRLKKGEALLGQSGEDNVCRVQIDLWKDAPQQKGPLQSPLCACTMCPALRRCALSGLPQKLDGAELDFGRTALRGAVRGFDALGESAALLEHQLSAAAKAPLSRAERLCAAGLLLSDIDGSAGLCRSVLRRWMAEYNRPARR